MTVCYLCFTLSSQAIILSHSLAVHGFRASSWIIVVYERVLMFDMREFMTPSVMPNFKIADQIWVKQRSLLIVMGVAMVFTIGVSYLFIVKLNL